MWPLLNSVLLLPLVVASPTFNHLHSINLVVDSSRVSPEEIQPRRDRNQDPNFPKLPTPDDVPNPGGPPPIPSSGVSPWADSNRPILDNVPHWAVCPTQYLNCSQCPRDPRCKRRPTASRPPLPWEVATPYQHGEPSALEGPQIPGFAAAGASAAVGENQEMCPLERCDRGAQCGQGATCTLGYCACTPGMKAGRGVYLNAVRGWDYPNALSVYVDPKVSCNVPCQDLFCSEVGRSKSCFGVDALVDHGPVRSAVIEGADYLETQGLGAGGHGVVQVPGADVDVE